MMTTTKILPRKFTGEMRMDGYAEEPQAWLSHFNKISHVNGWKTDAERIAYVGIFLVGEAERWYDINSEWIEDENTTWVQFQEQFIERFRPLRYSEELEERLQTMK